MDETGQAASKLTTSRFHLCIQCVAPKAILSNLVSLTREVLEELRIDAAVVGNDDPEPGLVGIQSSGHRPQVPPKSIEELKRISTIRLVAGVSTAELDIDTVAVIGMDGRVPEYWRMTAYCCQPTIDLIRISLFKLALDPLFNGRLRARRDSTNGVRPLAVRNRLVYGQLDPPAPSRGRALWIDANPHVDTVLEPYGLSMLCEVSRRSGFQNVIVSPYAEFERPEDQIEEALNIYTPEFVGVSVRNIDDAVTVRGTDGGSESIDTQFYLDSVKRLVERVRRVHTGPIVVGGTAMLRSPEPLMRKLSVQFGVQGPAVGVMSELFSKWHPTAQPNVNSVFSEVWRSIPGTIDLSATSVRSRSPTITESRYLERVPRDPVRLHLEQRRGIGAAIQGSYGCPLNCSYCAEATPRVPVALLSAVNMVDEIEWLNAEYGVKHFHLTDSEANLPFSRIRGFAEEIIRRRLNGKVSWSAYVTPSPFDLEAVPLLCESGLDLLKVSIDHFCKAPLKAMGKRHSPRQVAMFLDSFASSPHASKLSASILFGSKGESIESIRLALAKMRQLSRAGISFYYSAGIRIYQGTPLYDEWRSGHLETHSIFGPGSNDDALAPLVYCHPASPRQLAEWIDEETNDCDNIRRIALARSIQHDHALRLLNVAASAWYRCDRETALSVLRSLGGMGNEISLARAALKLDQQLRDGG